MFSLRVYRSSRTSWQTRAAIYIIYGLWICKCWNG